ncbi:galactokinase [Candidatus Vecturithrix granuli]|uniref:Galactokinase n=1 Tax=Vecturithrix granuli TaxID=1499967 RepID=A0A081C9C8_VECG1|nr:galactokinase [Candidatus Vecturithrix granuli]
MEFQRMADVVSTYKRQFGGNPAMLVSAPGRVNLIGEHTDYNEGFVLPMAIDKQIAIGGTLREDTQVRVYSLNFEELAEFSLKSLVNEHSWSDYLKGVMHELIKAGYALKGFDAVIGGNVPRGAGLSSSAAIEVGTAFFLAQLHDIDMPPEQMAKLCQRAENQFVGVNCGIMDQFISRLGKQDHALFLDCRDLRYQQIPFQLEGYTVVICNSNVKRKLVDSAYNERRAQCEEGVRLLKIHFPNIMALRDVSSTQLEEHAALLPPLVYQRCRHVITENERVMEAVHVLQAGNLERFGALLNQSHDSLRDDYEVSCRELDILVEIARGIEGTLGSRMTGAGFGGCTVSLLNTAALDHFQTALLVEYAKRTGIQADIYTSTAQDGARVETR